MIKNNEVYVLLTQQKNIVRAVCTSERNLHKAVDYWMKECPSQTLAYLLFEKNYLPEPLEWEWCYIAPKSRASLLKRGGGTIPPKCFWGINLVGITHKIFFE